jgi:hypothetical protein
MKSLLLVAALSAAAHGDAAITTQPLALAGRGISLGYEQLVTPRLSVVGLVGARAAAMGDYSSRTLSAGAELRWWPRARSGRELRGLYVAFHASAGRTRLVDETIDASVGTSLELTERVDVGWRFLPWRRLTIAPTLGLGDHQDLDTSGRLAPFNAPTLMIGLELGWLL